MEQKIMFHFQALSDGYILNESGSRNVPILAALETHIHHQHFALNMNKWKHTFRRDTDQNTIF